VADPERAAALATEVGLPEEYADAARNAATILQSILAMAAAQPAPPSLQAPRAADAAAPSSQPPATVWQPLGSQPQGSQLPGSQPLLVGGSQPPASFQSLLNSGLPDGLQGVLLPGQVLQYLPGGAAVLRTLGAGAPTAHGGRRAAPGGEGRPETAPAEAGDAADAPYASEEEQDAGALHDPSDPDYSARRGGGKGRQSAGSSPRKRRRKDADPAAQGAANQGAEQAAARRSVPHPPMPLHRSIPHVLHAAEAAPPDGGGTAPPRGPAAAHTSAEMDVIEALRDLHRG